MNSAPNETILFCVLGISPAILTETVWALAHEEVPIVPDRIIVATTTLGRARLEAELFAASADGDRRSVWEALLQSLREDGIDVENKLAFGLANDSVRLCSAIDPATGLTRDLEDIRCARENEAMANFILESLRGLVETPGTEVIASMAGGRKTMGALLYAAMTLVGREFDRITHVLVSEPFDSPALLPRFYFPSQPARTLQLPNGERFSVDAAKIELADVPFVPLRNAFARELGQMPETFTQLVRKYRREVRSTTIKYRLVVRTSIPIIEINGERYRLAPKEHVLMHLLVRMLRRRVPPYDRYAGAYEDLVALGRDFHERKPAGNLDDWRYDARFSENFDAEEIRKLVNQLKSRLRKQGPIPRAFAELLPRKGSFGLELDPDRVAVED